MHVQNYTHFNNVTHTHDTIKQLLSTKFDTGYDNKLLYWHISKYT